MLGIPRRNLIQWAAAAAAAPAPARWALAGTASAPASGGAAGLQPFSRALEGSHDLRISPWGPYSKHTFGISHVPDVDGLRFDLTVVPGLHRRMLAVPNAMWESGYHPWEAAADLSYYSARFELEWKDRIYADVSFSALDGHSRLVRCELVNNTEDPQDLVLHLLGGLALPTIGAGRSPVIHPAVVSLPEGAVWVDALDYDKLTFAKPAPADTLAYDGFMRGEVRGDELVGGSALGPAFGKEPGDRVSYAFTLPRALAAGELTIRYRLAAAGKVTLSLDGVARGAVTLVGTGAPAVARVALGRVAAGAQKLVLTAVSGTPGEIDGFVLAEAAAAKPRFESKVWTPRPTLEADPGARTLVLKYKDLPHHHYGLWWNFDAFQVREFLSDEIDRCLKTKVQVHPWNVIDCGGTGHFANVFMRPIFLAPRTHRVIHALVCSGDEGTVRRTLLTAKERLPASREAEGSWERARSKKASFGALSPGSDKYVPSQERMAATTLTNIVYPVYTRRSNIKHYTPGRWWDSLYTWDSGFVALGLTELDLDRAVDCLNAYCTPPGDPHQAFIHHGSPVPVQIYAFQEIWNRTQSKELLAHFYPRLRQYHAFLAGRLGSSTTRNLKSNLIRTWDYFYNSGGWDDYPPQYHIRQNKLGRFIAPMINTAQCIRTAKILSQAAAALGKTEDLAAYQADIDVLGKAILTHGWDAQAGYFGYVSHDDEGRPVGLFRHESGANFNMGLDGVSPLVAGICTPEQERTLFSHLMSEKKMWSPVGISTVDRSAPYYKREGYWNGAVWMPHQWFLWKTCLDLGRGTEALRIARTGLEVWQREVGRSYNCFEHFVIESGRGAGWHHFGGLSTPVLSWFGAYHRVGRLTGGFDVWVHAQQFGAGNRSLEAELQIAGQPGRQLHVLATMAPGRAYRATWDGRPAPLETVAPGVAQVTLPTRTRGTLKVSAARG